MDIPCNAYCPVHAPENVNEKEVKLAASKQKERAHKTWETQAQKSIQLGQH